MKVSLLTVAFSFFLVAAPAYAGPTPGGADTDGDTVENAFDNCTAVSNGSQADSNHNGCGDLCDVRCNWSGDKAVGSADVLILGMNFGMTGLLPGSAGDCAPPTSGLPLGDGAVGSADVLQLGMEFGMTAGPSGITNAQCNPSTCLCTPQ
jgi:hypothetical protein